MKGNDEFIARLRAANPIQTVAASYVQLIRRGRNYVCSCPFHSERSPSCTFFTDTDNFYCFGCGAGGDVITFIMKIENLTFIEAVRLLAQRSGMEVPEYNSGDKKRTQLKTRIYEMNRLAANFFYTNLIKGRDKSGLEYFVSRKLTPQTIKKYGLGYASDSFTELTGYLKSKGYSDDEINAAWLGGISKKTGRIYDIFRHRVMFPIVDTRGNILGFGGRVLDDSKPKYLNTSDTPVFNKGENLFSMNFAKNSDSKRLILCEGYMDVIAVNQAGFENVVATLGTAITPAQARLISHYAEEVVVSYDSDGAGQKATQKAINHFSDVGLKTRILHMTGAKDPDEYIKKYGSDRFRMLIEGSDDAVNFMLDRREEGLDLSTESDRAEFLDRAAKVLAGIESPLKREVYISRTSKKCDIPVQVLKTYVEELIKKNRRTENRREWKNTIVSAAYKRDDINPEAAEHRRESRAEEGVIRYLLKNPEKCSEIGEQCPPDVFVTSFNKRVYSALLEKLRDVDNFSVSMLADSFSVDEMGRISGIEAKNRELDINSGVFGDCVKVLKTYRPKNADNMTDDDLNGLFRSKR